ncbi:MAG: S-formylglutathione hydrolase [Rhodospirillaceae bacterium]
MSFETISEQRSFGGTQGIYRHLSRETGTPMRFAVYTPPQAKAANAPVLWFLAGLTCTEENFTVKAGAQRVAAELGLMLVAPDTSPRGDGVPDDPDNAYDFGLGAGFYLNATELPWAKHYRMYSYIVDELPGVIAAFPADMTRQGITGHSMGGHGALTIALKTPGRFNSVSAFAPVAAPTQAPWGEKAFSRYLGSVEAGRAHDATALVEDGARVPDVLIDQGDADKFLDSQLKPQLFANACAKAGIPCTLRMQPGYDHSYFFIASFIEDHLRWHAARMGV